MAVLNGERMHDTMERLLPGARSAALLWQGAAVLGGAALGAGQVYGGAAPFGLALVIGCPPSYCLAAALGTLAAGLAFQPMLLGVKLAVAAVAAAAVRRLIDGGAGALAGCLTLTAAQVLQIVLAGGLFNPGQTVTVGCTALLAAVFGWAFAHFPAREPRGVCLWLAVATACLQRCAVGPLAPGLALAAGAGLCAAIGGTLEQTAVLSIALAAAITASGPTLAYAALAVALGSLAASCLCPTASASLAAIVGSSAKNWPSGRVAPPWTLFKRPCRASSVRSRRIVDSLALSASHSSCTVAVRFSASRFRIRAKRSSANIGVCSFPGLCLTDFGVLWMFLIDCSFIIADYPSKSISFGHFRSPKMKGSFCAGCTKQKRLPKQTGSP